MTKKTKKIKTLEKQLKDSKKITELSKEVLSLMSERTELKNKIKSLDKTIETTASVLEIVRSELEEKTKVVALHKSARSFNKKRLHGAVELVEYAFNKDYINKKLPWYKNYEGAKDA